MRMRSNFAGLAVVLLMVVSGVTTLSSGRSQPGGSDEAALVASLQATVEMWNRGDINGFMAPYAESATYMTPAGLLAWTRCARATWRSTSPAATPDQQLRFDQLQVRRMGEDHALLTGRFVLTGGGKADQTGRFSLVWVRQAGGWRIIHDHSS